MTRSAENPVLAALLEKLDHDRDELAAATEAYRKKNDELARSLRLQGIASIPPPPKERV